MKKYLMTLAAVLCCTMTTTVFTACGSDDSDEPKVENNGPVSFTYKLTVEATEGADDQQDIVKTVVVCPNNQGAMVENEFSNLLEDLKLELSTPLTTLPYSCEIDINQSLLPDADITSKDKYKVGLHYKLAVTSYNKEGLALDYKEKEEGPIKTISAGNLNKAFPETTKLIITIDKNGKIAL